MPAGPRPERERVVATRDGRRVVILQEGGKRRTVRRIVCADPAERIERLEALELIQQAAPFAFNPIVRSQAKGDRLEIVEEFSDGFSLGGAIDLVREHISVNVALAIAYDLVRGLARLHGLKRRNGDRAHLIHGHLDLDAIVISTLGETLVVGVEGSRGDQKKDVEAVMTIVQDLLASRAMSPQGRGLLDRLSKLQFTVASQLEGAIKLYLDRQNPKELLAKRTRFCSLVINELGGPFNPLDGRSPIGEEEDSTVFEPVPSHIYRDTVETKAAQATGLGAAEPWRDDSGEPWPTSSNDSWKSLQPSWANQVEGWSEAGQLDPWKPEPGLAQPEDPTNIDAEAIEIDVLEDPAESESTDSALPMRQGQAVREGLMTKAAPPLDLPKKSHVMVGDYRVVASIGRGGMGEIYLARRVDQGGELVALKVLGLQESGDDAALDMFMDEAAILAQIDHPNVLRVIDFGKAHGRYFLATEYLEGRPLVRVMIEAYGREKGLDYATIAAIGADASYGLYAAHTTRAADGRPLQIVHRDVSPQNIFVTYNGTAKVIDFGVARAAERMSRTAVGLVKGKAAYMSPEQAEGRDVDARSDVFSLGICLWEMTAGKRLFKREKDYDTLLAVQLADIDPPTKVRGIPDPDFDRIILGALDRDRDKRTPSARHLALQLIEYASTKGGKERAGRMIDLMQRLFGEAAKKEYDLIRAIEARAATQEEADRLKELSGITGHGQKSGLEELDHFGKQSQQPAQGPTSSPTAAVLKSVERLKAEREHKPSSNPAAAVDPSMRLQEDLAVLSNETLEASSSAAIPVVESDFESVESDSAHHAIERSSTSPSGPQRAVIPEHNDTGDRVPTTLLGERRKRNRRAVAALLAVVASGVAAYAVIFHQPKKEKLALVGSRVDTPSTSSITGAADGREELKKTPVLVAAKTATTSFDVMLEELRAHGIKVRASQRTHLVPDGVGGSVILDEKADITRLEAGQARGFIIESSSPLKTSVTWVGSVDGGPWYARPLSVNDCPTTSVRIDAAGVALRYGGPEILLPHGGGNLRDVSLTPPSLADRLEVEPISVSLGREEADREQPHCEIGWWGKRVVLRRLPLGKYTLKWFGEGVSQTATLDVDVDRVTGGELVQTSSVPR
jgi:serine/threonine protein kinase